MVGGEFVAAVAFTLPGGLELLLLAPLLVAHWTAVLAGLGGTLRTALGAAVLAAVLLVDHREHGVHYVVGAAHAYALAGQQVEGVVGVQVLRGYGRAPAAQVETVLQFRVYFQ